MLNRSTIGIIFANMHDSAVSELTTDRSMASLPFFGRYRLVDTYLSSLADAGVETVGIITKSNYQSLMDHIGNARDWDLARRNGVTILPPYAYSSSDGVGAYHGRVEALYGVKKYLEERDGKYVILMDADHVCHPDFNALVSEHEASGADITMVCRTPDTDAESIANSVMARADENGRVTEMLFNISEEGFLQSMNLFIANKDVLLDLINKSMARNQVFFEKDVLARHLDTLNVRMSVYQGYVRRVSSLKRYYDVTLEMASPANMDALIDGRPVRTRVHDFPPVRYGVDCVVKNSVVSDGSIIDGTVEGSVLSRRVIVEKGAVVRNSILMADTVVEEGAVLEGVITDKRVTASAGTKIVGSADYPVYIKKGSRV